MIFISIKTLGVKGKLKIMEWIKRRLGITELINEQKQTNIWLQRTAEQSKRNADLQEKHNKAYHIK